MTSAKVWALDRRVFQQVMKKTGLQRIDDNLKFLRSVPLFERLTTDHMSKIADVLEVVSRLSKPAPFCYVYLCCGGGGVIDPCSGPRFTHFPAREDFLSPYFLNLRLLSFPCCHCQEGNDKDIFYIPRIIPKSAGNMNLIFLFPFGWTFRVIPQPNRSA